MRVAAILLIAIGLFTAGQAQFSTDTLVELGKSLVDSAVDKAKDALVNLGTDLLSKLLTNGDIFGKRDVSAIGGWVTRLTEKLKNLTDQGKQLATSIFADAMNKLKSLADTYHAAIGSVKDAAGIIDHIDSVVADHHTKQKRVVKDLIQKGKDLLSDAVDSAKDLAAKLKEHASDVVSALLQKGVDVFGKRDLTDHLQAIGNAISSAVNPFKDIVSGLGDTLKGHFSNLVDTVKGHANALKTKLDPHLSDLKGHGQKLMDHGKNALDALSEVVSDILNQTVDNASDSLSGLAKTVGAAGNTVVGHFAGTDSDSN